MPVPQSAIIIGGSVAGLLQGLQLKRQGANVIVLEQDPSSDRHSHESGVSIGPTVVKLLQQYDATGRPAAIPARYMSAAWRLRPRVGSVTWKHNMSNWGCLYLILRANFDGMASETVPQPPAPRPTDGVVEYHAGRKATEVSYNSEKDIMTVNYVDSVTGAHGTVSASIVIAADGVHSTIRKIMQVPTRKDYAGYIGWRGTVPERLLSKETVEYFSNRLNFTFLKGTYFISYLIPTEAGNVDPGQRLVNWVWYFVVPENSAEMDAIFTDVDGKLHPNTVPHGKIKPKIWSEQIARYISQMTAPLAEIVTKTPRPFVTKVGEAEAAAASFYDGRLVLVGDAFTGFRSHLGMASEQAARHCLQLNRVWHGEITLEQRDREARFYSKRFILLNRMIGLTGLGLMWEVFKIAIAYLMILAEYKFF
ncbi:FAD binding domain protein [Penicillium verhagenii]|nr:FAD binding domain protein [Penicillium verhagenii]